MKPHIYTITIDQNLTLEDEIKAYNLAREMREMHYEMENGDYLIECPFEVKTV